MSGVLAYSSRISVVHRHAPFALREINSWLRTQHAFVHTEAQRLGRPLMAWSAVRLWQDLRDCGDAMVSKRTAQGFVRKQGGKSCKLSHAPRALRRRLEILRGAGLIRDYGTHISPCIRHDHVADRVQMNRSDRLFLGSRRSRETAPQMALLTVKSASNRQSERSNPYGIRTNSCRGAHAAGQPRGDRGRFCRQLAAKPPDGPKCSTVAVADIPTVRAGRVPVDTLAGYGDRIARPKGITQKAGFVPMRDVSRLDEMSQKLRAAIEVRCQTRAGGPEATVLALTSGPSGMRQDYARRLAAAIQARERGSPPGVPWEPFPPTRCP